MKMNNKQWRLVIVTLLGVTGSAVLEPPTGARADEGGVSFWLPGQFGSLAATPIQPGFSFASIYYHTSVTAGSEVAFARQVSRGNIMVNFNASVVANLKADADTMLLVPTYVFATPVLGGQLAISTAAIVGRSAASVDATLTGLGPLGLTASGSRSDAVTGFGDLYPQAALRWNQGVHNYMVYVTGDVPVGDYDSSRLANLGIGHGAVDGGFGYTYFNPQTGHEFSAVTGLTYNFKNTSTDYQNGVDWHLDWGASQFLSKQLQVGLVGYVYQQISADSGAGDRVGAFQSRVIGIGPQVGYIFPIGQSQGYLNLKGYREFAAADRPDGWNVWLTFAISPVAPPPTSPPVRPIITK
jgi:hypothetical protein